MDWYALLYSVLGGLAGGLFTYLGVVMTIRYEERKRKEDKEEQIIKERPRLKIVDYKEPHDQSSLPVCDIDATILQIEKVENLTKLPRFIYEKQSKDDNAYGCVEYTFINDGKTEIRDATLATNTPDKGTSCLPTKSRQYFIEHKYLSAYVDSSKRFIKPGDKLTLRVCFLKEEMPISVITASLTLYLEDANGNFWYQPLFIPYKNIEDSNLTSFKEFRNNTDIGFIIDLYKNKEII